MSATNGTCTFLYSVTDRASSRPCNIASQVRNRVMFVWSTHDTHEAHTCPVRPYVQTHMVRKYSRV